VKTRAAICLATWFGCGYSPVGPGTAGSLGAIALAWPLVSALGWGQLHLAFLAAALTAPGIWAAGVTARVKGLKDPGIVVVDEVIGQWITLVGASRFNWKSWLIGFVLFRLFDIWKPWPARRLEALPSGTGIVADDVMAGVYGAAALWLLGWWDLY
jgi:phosphatidylglycerophosphatase A